MASSSSPSLLINHLSRQLSRLTFLEYTVRNPSSRSAIGGGVVAAAAVARNAPNAGFRVSRGLSTLMATTATSPPSSSLPFLLSPLQQRFYGSSIMPPPPTLASLTGWGGGEERHTPNRTGVRSMATNRKAIDAKNARRLKIQQKKKKNKPAAGSGGGGVTEDADASESSSDAVATASASNQPFLQHQEWVKFQQSISVEGFQTGQTMTATVLKKSRGGRQARRKREKELARLGGTAAAASAGSATTANTKFPAIRYSVDETQELLRQAYEALPEREGKRGTRNLRRQADRWKAVRDGRSQYKKHIVLAHGRRMEKRKYKRDRVVQAKVDASVQRQNDVEYQARVLKVWAQKMHGRRSGSDVDGGDEGDRVGAKAAAIEA